MKFYIFRHGETFSSINNDSGYGDKQFTAEILPEGRVVIEKLAEYLAAAKPDHAASSEILRARQTADIVSNITGVKFKTDPRLNEMLDENGLEPNYPYSGYFEEKRAEVESFLDEMKKKNFRTVFVCTHGYVIAALKNLLVYNSFPLEKVHDYPKPGVLIIVENGVAREIDFN